MADDHNILLIGMPTAGKTTLSLEIAARTGRKRIGMDAEIVRRCGMSIPEIFDRYGEPWFRDQETQLALHIGKEKRCVIDSGGGLVLRPENMAAFAGHAVVIWLDRAPEYLLAGHGRPLSSDRRALMELYEKRRPLYRHYADIIIQNNGTIDEAVEWILSELEKKGL